MISADCASDKEITAEGAEQLYKSGKREEAAEVTYAFTSCGVTASAAGAQAVRAKNTMRRILFMQMGRRATPYPYGST